MRRILIDTGAIYAFVTRTDAHHETARTFTHELMATQGSFILADTVFAETMTLLKARLGTAVALRVGQELRRNAIYKWSVLGPDGERDTWAIFQQYQDKEWSYTDCGILALARRLKITDVFAFDGHFEQMPGIFRLP
jgi:predicted nucleic acid-binding protein